MPLPQPDPSNPALPAPLFADVDAVRGDHMRANNQLIWENLQYLFDFTGRTTDTLTEGATNLYYTDVRAKAAALAAALTGYAVGSDAALAATDTILQAFGKLQGQRDALAARVVSLEAQGAWTAWTPTIQGGGTLSGVNCKYAVINKVLHIVGVATLGTISAAEFQLSLPGAYTVLTGAATFPVGSLFRCVSVANDTKAFVLTATGGNSYLTIGVFPEYILGVNVQTTISTNTYFGNANVVTFHATVPIN